MAEYTRELATDIMFPHIDVYRKFKDGVHYAWYICTHEGYVMYDTTAEYYEIDEETDEEVLVTYYFYSAHLPLNYDFVNFPWVAVPISEADENHIFGVGEDNNHEVM